MPRINLWASPPSLDLRTPDTELLSQQQSAQSPAQQNCRAAQWQANESGRCDCSTGMWIRWAAHAPIGDSRRLGVSPTRVRRHVLDPIVDTYNESRLSTYRRLFTFSCIHHFLYYG